MNEEEIFLRAIEFDSPDQQEAFLTEACGADSGLRARIDALLESHEAASGFLQEPTRLHSDDDRPDAADLLPEQASVPYFGNYRVLNLIARGGMGVVYRARQVNLNRIVALKTMLAGRLASAEEIQRFQTEAEAAARLDHPHIVPIHEVGEHENLHYFSMGFVDGESLARTYDHDLPDPREAAELMATVAGAVQYAHTQGVIHRDLKPANILIDRDGQPRITDFGLAKRVDVEQGLTGTGQVLGSPGYMAPEQVQDAAEISPATDVYALGAVLYRLLTGRPPFQSDNPVDTMLQTVHRDAVPPRLLNTNIPRDLETIVLSCLRKAPAKRYATAGELAADLNHWLCGEPITARPVSALERSWRWCRRNPALASLSVLIVIIVAGAAWSINEARLEARRQQIRAEQNAGRALQQEGISRENELEALQQKAMVEEQKLVAERNACNTDMLLVQREWEDAQFASFTRLLDRHRDHDESKRFEWNYWNRLRHSELLALNRPRFSLSNLSFSPDGLWLACVSDDEVQLWNPAMPKGIRLEGLTARVSDFSFSPDGKVLAATDYDGTVKIWGVPAGWPNEWLGGWDIAGRRAMLTFKAHADRIGSVAFSPDGTQLATATIDLSDDDSSVKVWDASTGQETLALTGFTQPVEKVLFSSGGTQLISVGTKPEKRIGIDWFVGTPSELKVWDLSTGQAVFTLQGHTGYVSSVSVSSDGARLASASGDGTVRLWDLSTGQELLTLEGHTGSVTSVSFSSDGARLASASFDRTVRVWDADTGQETHTLRGHTGTVYSVSFSLDGSRLASAGSDNTARVWDTDTGEEIRILKGYQDSVESVAFSHDGTRLAAASRDGTVKVWDLATDPEVLTLMATDRESLTQPGDRNLLGIVSFSPNAMQLVSSSVFGTVTVWDVSTGQQELALKEHTDGRIGALFSPDGRKLASSIRNVVKLWNMITQETLTLTGHTEMVTDMSFSPDGLRLATASDDGVRAWNSSTGQEMFTLTGHRNRVDRVSFSPDGMQLATASQDNTVKVWNTATGDETFTLAGLSGSVRSLLFSPDGTHLAAAGDGGVKLWDVATGKEIMFFEGMKPGYLCFHADGLRMLSTHDDGTLQLVKFSIGAESEVLTIRGQDTSFSGTGSFSPDGTRLACGGPDGQVRIYDTVTGHTTLTFTGHSGMVGSVLFSPDGTRLASAGINGTVKIWDARPWTPHLREEAQVRGLLTSRRDRVTSLQELRATIREDQVISSSVRTKALNAMELFWKNRSRSRKIPTGPL